MSSGDQFNGRKFSDELRDQIHGDIRERIRDKMRARGEHRSGVLPGAILVVIGTIILLDHLGIFPAYRLWSLWPGALIVTGVVRLVECPRNRALSVLLIVVGGLFLAANLGYLRLSWNEFWPIVLIAAGLAMILGRTPLRFRLGTTFIPKSGSSSSSADTNIPPEAGAFTASATFGGVERRVSVNNFKGGTVSAFFGGVELDFRGADIEGEEATIYVDVLFGGIELVVPERWTVLHEGQSMFAGYSDETRPPLPDVPGAPPKKRLILRGHIVFGGVTVKN